MKWVTLIENDYNTYPKEGYTVIVSDGTNFDTAWYLMSSEYIWMKSNLKSDYSDEFNQFKITKWSYINE